MLTFGGIIIMLYLLDTIHCLYANECACVSVNGVAGFLVLMWHSSIDVHRFPSKRFSSKCRILAENAERKKERERKKIKTRNTQAHAHTHHLNIRLYSPCAQLVFVKLFQLTHSNGEHTTSEHINSVLQSAIDSNQSCD